MTGLSGLTAVWTVETELGQEPGTFYQTVYSHWFISVTAVLQLVLEACAGWKLRARIPARAEAAASTVRLA